MIALYKDPEGEHIFKKASSQPPSSSLSQPASNIQHVSQTTPNSQNNMKEPGINSLDCLADDQKRKETSTTLTDAVTDCMTQLKSVTIEPLEIEDERGRHKSSRSKFTSSSDEPLSCDN